MYQDLSFMKVPLPEDVLKLCRSPENDSLFPGREGYSTGA